MYEDLLIKTGMTLREVKAYTTLLSQGELMASELSKKTGLIRTNTYDILNSLVRKGVVAYAIRNGKKYFRAADANKLIDYIDTQREDLKEIRDKVYSVLPKFKPVDLVKSRPQIEVYEGKEGLKTILEMSVRESLRTGKEILGISVQQEKCRILAGPYHVRWYENRGKEKIKARYLMSANEKIIQVKYTRFKTLPPSAKNPNEIFIFGDITTQFFFVGELFTAIVIQNREITEKYRDYFDFLWKLIK